MSTRSASDGYFTLIAKGEPFRLLFPVGTAIGIFGVLLWPLYAWHFIATYPGVAHPRIMIEGFLTCFVVGFLGTALPRLLDVPRINMMEAFGFSCALVCVAWLHFNGHTLWGDEMFFFTMLAFVLALASRAILRRDTPPPAFILVLMGILSALAGAGILIAGYMGVQGLPLWVITLGHLLLHQGYLLLPILGIGAFLLPRFFALENRQSFPESLAPPPGWSERAAFAYFCGSAIIAGFVIEALGAVRWGCALRGVAAAIFFFREVPLHRANSAGGSLALGLRIAMAAIPCAYLLMAIWPAHVLSFLHVLFITGFSLITFIVASRVVLGHSGQSQKFRAKMKSVLWLIGLVVLAMFTRVSADWMGAAAMRHYAYAAMAWIAGAVVWAVTILPGVRRADAE